MDLVIVYEDNDIIVVNKPAGVPVQSSSLRTRDLVSMLKNYRKEKENLGGEPYVGVVHRLDQPVGGLLVFGKNQKAAGSLSAQVRDGRMKKVYHALVSEKPRDEEGMLMDYLLKDGRTNTSKVVKEDIKGAKKSQLSYKLLGSEGDYYLMEIQLYTGRHHQIRVQMAHGGMPLMGDRKYNPRGEHQGNVLGLTAWELCFFHPTTGKQMKFTL